MASTLHAQEDPKISAHNNSQHIDYAKGSSVSSGVLDSPDYALAGASLGTTLLEANGRIILVPTPSSDPNDPLNWSWSLKVLITMVSCIAVLLSNFLAAGPTVAIVAIAEEFTGIPPLVQKTSYFFSVSALFQGIGIFFWMPLINRYGRRPIYVTAFVDFTLCVIWSGLATSYASELVARIGVGFFSGGAECLCPLTINDLWFLHERGRWMAMYQTFLSIGVSIGIILSGLIENGTGNWRNIYWLGLAFIGTATIIVIFAFPETAYHRTLPDKSHLFAEERPPHDSHDVDAEKDLPEPQPGAGVMTSPTPPPKKTYVQSLALYNGVFTEESLWKMFIRPFGLIFLPAVLWCILVFSATIGFLVGITGNFAVALGSPPYNFKAVDSGLCFISGMIGGLIGIPVGGIFGDWVAARATHRNGGIREPEHRLPAIAPAVIATPLALILYGVGIQHGLHWIMPTIGLGLLTFSIVAGTNIAFVYVIDCYKPIAGEVIVAILGFKAVIGFGLGFGTNSWIALEGYQNAFGEMAGIAAFFLLLAIPFIFWGEYIRKSSFRWRITSWIRWDADRDDVQVILH